MYGAFYYDEVTLKVYKSEPHLHEESIVYSWNEWVVHQDRRGSRRFVSLFLQTILCKAAVKSSRAVLGWREDLWVMIVQCWTNAMKRRVWSVLL